MRFQVLLLLVSVLGLAVDGFYQHVSWNTKSGCSISSVYDTKIEDFALRGTTVPTAAGSNEVRCKEGPRPPTRPSLHKSVDLDPSEPFTFGYVKIGKILGPHGVKGDVKVLLESDFAPQHVKVGSVLFVRKPGRRCPRAVRVTSSRRQGVAADNTYLLQLNSIRSRTIATAFKQYEVYIRDSGVTPQLNKGEFLIRDVVGMDCFLYKHYDAVCAARGATGSSIDCDDTGDSAPPPIGRVAGVVPPDEMCVGAAAALLMHAQLEIQLLPSLEKPPIFSEDSRVSGSDRKGRSSKSSGAVKATNTNTVEKHQGSKAKANSKQLYCLVPLVRSIVPVVDSARRCVFLDPPLGLLDTTYEVADKLGPVRGFLPAHIAALSGGDRAYLAARTFAL